MGDDDGSSLWRGGGTISLAWSFRPPIAAGITRVACETKRGRLVLAGGADGGLCLLDRKGQADGAAKRRPATLAALRPGVGEEGGHDGAVEATAWLPEDDRLFVSGGDHRVKLWDASAPDQCVLTANLHHAVRGAAVTEGPPAYVAAALGDGTVRLLDLRKGRAVSTLQGHTKPPLCVAWGTPGTSRLYSGGMDGTLRAWDTRMGARSLFLFDAHGDSEQPPLKRLRSADERETAGRRRGAGVSFATALANNRIEPYRFRSMQSVLGSHQPAQGGQRYRSAGTGPMLTSPTQAVEAADSDLGLSDLGRLTREARSATARWTEEARLAERHGIDPSRREYEHDAASAHGGAVLALAFAGPQRVGPATAKLLSCGADSRVRAWDTATGGPASAASRGAPSKPAPPDGGTLELSGARGRTAPKYFDVNCWSAPQALQIDADGGMEDVCFVPEKDLVALYCLRSGSLVCHLRAHKGNIHAVHRLSSGNELLTAAEDGLILCWRAAARTEEIICLD
eukprot:TRINITY_DN1882_c0_g1_i1.p1 TRINITY_DN1882_c0_g1~~TRINITY_DN1882_c0_g1_i1.p1  ORF type:complete len:511 (+),score=94.92 TRINITY_DN1882_c0_g1_i1:90-1622(+)